MYNNQAYVGFKIPKQLALTPKYYFTGSFTSVIDNITSNTINVGRVFSVNANDGSFNPTFNNNVSVGADNVTQMSAVDPVSGKIYVCGFFTTFNGVSSRYLVRLNTDGTVDKTYGTNFNDFILWVYVTPDQKVLCVGNFTTYLGVSANRIVRLNEDGTRDGTFNVGTGLNGQAQSIDADSTHYYVSGSFLQYKSTNSGRLAKIEISNGNKIGTFTGFNGNTFGVKVFGNDLYIGGDTFNRYNGGTGNLVVPTNLCKLNITTTPMLPVASFTTNLGAVGFGQRVSFFDLNDTGTALYVPHSGTTLSGATVRKFIKISSAGVRDATYVAPLVLGSSGNPRANLVNDTDQRVIGVGDFELTSLSTQQRIVALDINSGSVNSSIFNYQMGGGVVTNVLYLQ